MVDLSIEIAGLRLRNPLVAASGSITHTLLRIKKAEKAHCGAVITKAIVLQPEDNTKRPSRRRLFLQEGIDLIKAAKKESKIPIIANLFGAGRNTDGWVSLALECEKAGADALELNFSCPNVGILQKRLEDTKAGESGALGALLGQSPQLAGEAAKAVCDAVKIPVFCKMTPEAPDIAAVAKACVNAGAAGISAINALSRFGGVDIYNGGRTKTIDLSKDQNTYVCNPDDPLLSPAFKDRALRDVSVIARALPDTPILGGGGLYNFEDAIEMIMCGAAAATFCSAVMRKGWEIFTKMEREIKRYMEKMGYERVSDFKGAGLKYIVPQGKARWIVTYPVIDLDRCNGCGVCAKMGHCEAYTVKDKKAVVDLSKCVGCVYCQSICPRKAIIMKETGRYAYED
jgi:dihydroorotate dehydrogenase/Pyruvate/2-oxoacid:ferredoxin oxidoreductase delta subunit